MKNQLCQTSFSLAAYALLGLVTARPAAAASLYSVTKIGTFDIYTEALGINNFGQVVGFLYNANGDQHAFLYSSGKLQDIGALPGGAFSVAFSINDEGQVVGTSQIASRQQHAFLYSSGKLQDLGTLPVNNVSGSIQPYTQANYNDSYATGINDFGQVVGYSSTANYGKYNHAFLYNDGKLQDLGTLSGGTSSLGYGINNKGQVVGVAFTADGFGRAFLYSGGKLQNLGTLPSNAYSEADAINNQDQVAGYSYNGSSSRAFLYSEGKLQNLGTLPGSNYSYARGLNNEGQVVGFSTNYSGEQQAFLYSDGKLQDLDSLIDPKYGVTLTQAVGINDRGQIVASGYSNGSDNTYILTPSSTPVPETSSSGTYTLAFGFIGAVYLRFQAILEYLLGIKIGKFLQPFRER